MADHGVTVQRFFVADTANDALEAAKRLSKLTSSGVKFALAINPSGECKLLCCKYILLHTIVKPEAHPFCRREVLPR